MPFDNDKRVSCFNPKLANLKNLKQKGGVKKGDGIEGGCINNFRREVFMKRFLFGLLIISFGSSAFADCRESYERASHNRGAGKG